ncbi:hypothetical protein CPB97_002154 [Podila verticillata]|nr:hypothetical protein CPB97_002154 [Podila verticillata]
MLMEKEQERQHLVANLDLAARLGLGLQQQLEQVELNSFAKLQSLQDQNMMLQSRANQAMELSSQLTGSEDEVKTLTGHNVSLQRELDSCRKDLKTFRRELDGLVEQMTEMGAEVVDAKSKVNSYSRRLGEVEQELSTTQELNVNLQVQLENALERQKQSHSTTAQVVKLIQSDLGKVVSESGMIRSTLEELENRQVKCEGKVVEMVSNTREYAQLLEEAQDTIHTLRQESDMEGRGWPHGSSVVKKKIEPARKYSTLAQENPELRNGLEEEEEVEEEVEEEQVEEDPELWSEPTGARSLDTELKEEPEQDQSTNDHNWSDHQSMDAIVSELKESTPPSSPASYHSKQTPASSPQPPVPKALPVDNQTQTDIIIPKIPPQKLSLSLSAELHQRLEEHNQQSALQGSSRPPWNPSVALENLAQAPTQRSPGSRSGGRSMSQSHMSPRSTGSRIGPSGMPSPHPSLSSSMSSLSEAIAGNRPRGASSFSSESGLKAWANSSVHPLEPSSITTKAKPKASTAQKKPAGLTGATSTRSQSTTRERTRATTISGGGDRAVTRRATSDDSTPASGSRTTRAPSRSRSTAPESKMLQPSMSASTLSSSRSMTPAGPARQPPTPTTVAFGRTSKAPPSPSSSTSASGPRSTVASSGRTTPSPAPGPRPLTPSTSSSPSQPRASRATTSSKGSGSRRPSLTPTPIPESSLPPVPALPANIANAKSSD